MNFTADNFNLSAFCHALHREEREDERIDNMKPIRVRTQGERPRLDFARGTADYRALPFIGTGAR